MMLLDIGGFTHDAPAWVNILINSILLVGAGYLTLRTLRSGESIFAAGFGLFGLGQLVYMTHHAGLSALLFVHLLGDSTVFIAFVLIFVGLAQHGIVKVETGRDAEHAPRPLHAHDSREHTM